MGYLHPANLCCRWGSLGVPGLGVTPMKLVLSTWFWQSIAPMMASCGLLCSPVTALLKRSNDMFSPQSLLPGALQFTVATTASCLAHWLVWLARWLSLISLALTSQNSVPSFATLWWDSFIKGCFTLKAYLLKIMAYPQRSLRCYWIRSKEEEEAKLTKKPHSELSENEEIYILYSILYSKCQ